MPWRVWRNVAPTSGGRLVVRALPSASRTRMGGRVIDTSHSQNRARVRRREFERYVQEYARAYWERWGWFLKDNPAYKHLEKRVGGADVDAEGSDQ